MDDLAFDTALIDSFFALVADRGWARVSVAEAARQAELPLEQARQRFPGKLKVLRRFAALADQQALATAATEGGARDRLFDLLMQRVDFFQRRRAGVLALFRHLPLDPPLAMGEVCISLRSMGWMLEAAGVSASGPLGQLRRKGLLAVWLWTLNAWRRDDSEDLSATMAALDQALIRAESASAWLRHREKKDEELPPG